MRKEKIKKYLKSNQDLFQQARNEQKAFHSEPLMDRDIPPMDWLPENNREFRSQGTKEGKTRKPWYLSKGLWVPVTACVVLVLIFSTNQWGRVTASSAYTAVVKLFSGGSSIQYGQGDKNITAPTPDQDIKPYTSIDEVRKALGKKIALNTSGCEIESIEVAHEGFYTIVETIYDTGKNTIILKQTMQDVKTEWSNSQNYHFDQPFYEKLSDGTEMVGYVNESNAYAVVYKSDMMLEVISKDIPKDDFRAFIRNVKFQ